MSDIAEDIKQEMQQQGLTLDEMIRQVDNAILASAQAVSYKIGSRSITRSSVSELRKLRAEMLAEKAQSENHAGFFAQTSVAVFEGR